MKKILLILVCLGAINLTNAQKIAHIQLDSLINLMPEMKQVKDIAQAYSKDLEKTLIQMDDELQKKYNDYMAAQANMSDLVRKTKEDEIQSLQRRIEDFRTQAQQDYQKKQNELVSPVYDKAKKAIDAVAKDLGYKYVVDTSTGSVLYSEPAEDILMQVKKKLDSMPAANIPGANTNTEKPKTSPAPKTGGK